ncbi:hypothetical protein M1146_04890 [Patescibacteria group bacterium]|nr:hypothetical protein [Patescibacteria group bacterium]
MNKELELKAKALVDKYNQIVKAKNLDNWVELQGNIIVHSGDDCYNTFEIQGDVDLEEFKTITNIELNI